MQLRSAHRAYEPFHCITGCHSQPHIGLLSLHLVKGLRKRKIPCLLESSHLRTSEQAISTYGRRCSLQRIQIREPTCIYAQPLIRSHFGTHS